MFIATLVRDIYTPNFSSLLRLPLYLCPVSAGFPSPAEDYIEGRLDLNRYLVKHPAATFFVRVTGDSMIDAGIHPGDLLIVDRAIAPTNGKIVIAVLNGELTVKRVRQSKQKLLLIPENPQYPSLEIRSEMDFQIWGVVTNVIHPL
ncbi:translesion error-prone DNA polymerase V autoproteolytic subunit [Tumidithrix elongata RA019]|uniref:Translesion error-prone DNA polymerase V autoproteolytic subunit n=1 Tax=Tumidithrix elongata BACA0141 TaxID=2716417 RepID=A0AAW9PUN2_9CYAN|nr:translesion error-prone DNA polymerase V autoproteolytic subunit [Tumidithrix elongata RA019]